MSRKKQRRPADFREYRRAIPTERKGLKKGLGIDPKACWV